MNANRRTRKPSSGIRSAMFIEPVARFRSPFKTKFGIPRQAGLVPELKGRIVFEPRFRSADAVRGLEGFEYIWLIWGFSGNKPRSAAEATLFLPLTWHQQEPSPRSSAWYCIETAAMAPSSIHSSCSRGSPRTAMTTGAPATKCDPASRISESRLILSLLSVTTNRHFLCPFAVGDINAALRIVLTSSSLTHSSVKDL